MTRAQRRRDRSFPFGLLVAAILIQAASAPGQTVGLSVLVGPIVDDLGVSRSAVSTAYLVGTLGGALALRPVGRLLDRIGVRRVAVGVGALFGLVTASMAGATGILALTIGFVGTRALGQGALTLTATTSVVVGFDRRRGLAIGLTSALGGALMSLVPLGVLVLLDQVGLSATWVVLGATSGALVVGLGLSPLLDQREVSPIDDVGFDVSPTKHSWEAAAAMRTPAFVVTIAAVSLSALVATALTFHQIDLLAERGLSEAQAAANFLPQTLAGAAAAIGA
ncbi:MAG: MFS transporter, partial [Microthrixaceae bacterium]